MESRVYSMRTFGNGDLFKATVYGCTYVLFDALLAWFWDVEIIPYIKFDLDMRPLQLLVCEDYEFI
jgi:hypothetical protein